MILLPLALAAMPIAMNGRSDPSSLARQYVRMRAAAASGDQATAVAETAALLAREPGNATIAQTAYRQALTGGDRALALKAATALQAIGRAPPDAPLLFAVDAIDRKDWKAARAAVDTIVADKVFAFMAPGLRAWITFGAGDGDPLVALDAAKGDGMSASYYAPQRVLMLLALRRPAEAATVAGGVSAAGARLKLLIAAALLREHRASEAQAFLAGDDDILEAARKRIAAGKPIELGIATAGDGVGELLTQLALDFQRERLLPAALMMARLATYAAPGNAGARITTASFLAKAGKSDAAVKVLEPIGRDDPFRLSADTLRVAILVDTGDKAAALAAVLAETKAPGAGAAQWGRLGDVYLSADKPADAARAYARAIAIEPERTDLWTLWLQQGAALELAGDWPAAKVALKKAYALAPGEPSVLNHLGYSELSRRENIEAAAAMIEQASKLRPDDPAINDSLGWAHYLRGDVASAVTLLEKAAGGDPGEPTINEHLGDVYWTAGRRIEARYAWRAALVTADAKDAGRIRAKLDTGLSAATAAP